MSDHHSPVSDGVILRHAVARDELIACFPVISALRRNLKNEQEWVSRALEMELRGYRVLAVWEGDRPVALAGYRVMDNLIHGRFLYVDDLITLEDQRGKGRGTALLTELSVIGKDEACRRLVLDTAAANIDARRFYTREGLLDVVIGFVKPLTEDA